MEIMEIAASIDEYIRRRFSVPADDADFNRDVHLFDYGYVDSFGAVDLTMFVESEFSVKISNEDMVVCPLTTINEIATFVDGRRRGEH
jgi:methoxymalonate biosynthesis acyl carrier protein